MILSLNPDHQYQSRDHFKPYISKKAAEEYEWNASNENSTRSTKFQKLRFNGDEAVVKKVYSFLHANTGLRLPMFVDDYKTMLQSAEAVLKRDVL